jgi:hypothetical protein
MHVYSSILDPYEPPRPRRVYDNAQIAKRRRSLLSALFEGLKNREVGEPVVADLSRRPSLGWASKLAPTKVDLRIPRRHLRADPGVSDALCRHDRKGASCLRRPSLRRAS